MLVACVLIPRFQLRAAAGRSWRCEEAALAPPPGGRQVVGEVSREAEAKGIEIGMELGEALSRCPTLRLVAPHPTRAAEIWEGVCGRLEGIGAAVETGRQGEAFFAVEGLCGLYGDPAGVLGAAREAIEAPARIAAAPGRFAAALAAERGSRLPRPLREGTRAEAIVGERILRGLLGPAPVAALRGRLSEDEAAEGALIDALRRLGIKTLGRLAVLTDDQAADRFGELGLRALRLARGEDEPLRPRPPREDLSAEIDLAEGAAGPQLDRAVGFLVDRLLADPARRERTILALRLSAPLCEGGSWSADQVLARPSAAAETIRPLLVPRLQDLPGPAAALRLRALAFGPPAARQLELACDGPEPRRRRLGSAVREVHTASGAAALLRLIDLEPRSRIPERRFLLSPYPER